MTAQSSIVAHVHNALARNIKEFCNKLNEAAPVPALSEYIALEKKVKALSEMIGPLIWELLALCASWTCVFLSMGIFASSTNSPVAWYVIAMAVWPTPIYELARLTRHTETMRGRIAKVSTDPPSIPRIVLERAQTQPPGTEPNLDALIRYIQASDAGFSLWPIGVIALRDVFSTVSKFGTVVSVVYGAAKTVQQKYG